MNNSSYYFSFRRVLVGLLILTHTFSCFSNKKLPVSSKHDTSSVKKSCIDEALIGQLDERNEDEKLLKETLQKLNKTKCEGINKKLDSKDVSVLGLALFVVGGKQKSEEKLRVTEEITLNLIDNGAKFKDIMPGESVADVLEYLCQIFTQEALKKCIEAFHKENISLSSPDFLNALYPLHDNQAINQNDSVEIVKMLIAGGLDIDAVDENKNTILHGISLVEKIEEKDRLSFLKWLFVLHSKLEKFDLSASLNKKNDANQTPQEVAKSENLNDLAEMLATKPAGIASLLESNFPVNSWHRSALQQYMKSSQDNEAYKALYDLLGEISDTTMLNKKTAMWGQNNEASALGLSVRLSKDQAPCIKDIVNDLLKNGASTDSIITLDKIRKPLMMEVMGNEYDENLRARLIDASHQQEYDGILDKKLIIDLGEQIKAEQDADDRNDWMALKLELEKIKTKADLNNDAYSIKVTWGEAEITVSVLGGALAMCTEESDAKNDKIFEKIAHALLEHGASTAGVASQEGARFPLLMLMGNCSLDLQKKMIAKSTKNTVNGSVQFGDGDERPLEIISSILDNEELEPLDRKALIKLARQKDLEINTIVAGTGNTLLHCYIKKNGKEAIKILLALHQEGVFNLHGSFVQENNALETPLALASDADDQSIYRLLKKTMLEDAVRKGPHRSLIDELDNLVKGLPDASNTENIELFSIAVLEIATGDRSPNDYFLELVNEDFDLLLMAIMMSKNGTGVLDFFKKTNKFLYKNELLSTQALFEVASPAALKWCCTNSPLAQGRNISSIKLLLEKNENFTDTEKEAFLEWLKKKKKPQPVKAIEELYRKMSTFSETYKFSGGASTMVGDFARKLYPQLGKDIFSINTSSNLLWEAINTFSKLSNQLEKELLEEIIVGLLEAGVKDSTSDSLQAGLKFDLPKETLKKIIAASNLNLPFDEIQEILSLTHKNVNKQELVRALVAHGLDIHTTNSYGYTLLNNYICYENSEMTKWLFELDQNNIIDLHQSLTHRDKDQDTPLPLDIAISNQCCIAEMKTCIKNKLQEVCPNLYTAIGEKKDGENDWYTIAVALIKIHKKKGSFKNAFIKKGGESKEIFPLPQYALRLSGNQALLNFLKDQGVTFDNTYKESNVCYISPDSLNWLLDNDFKPTETDCLSHLVFALFQNENISASDKSTLYQRIFEGCYSNDKTCQLLQALQLPEGHGFGKYDVVIKAGLIDEVAGRKSHLTISKKKYQPSNLALCYPGNQELLNYLKGKGIKFDTFYNKKGEEVTGSAIYHMARNASSDSLNWLLDNKFLPQEKEYLSDIKIHLFKKNKQIQDSEAKAILEKIEELQNPELFKLLQALQLPKGHFFEKIDIFIKAGLIDEVAGRGSPLTISKKKYQPSSLALCYPGNQEVLKYLKEEGIKFNKFYNKKGEEVTGSAIYHMARNASSDSLNWLLDNKFLPQKKECLSDIVVDLDKNKNLDGTKIKALLVKMDKQCPDFFMSMVEGVEMPCLHLLGLENSVKPGRLLCWIKRMKNLDSQKEHLQALDIEKNEEPFWLEALSSWKCIKDSQLITEESVPGQILKELIKPLGLLESEEDKKNHIRVCLEIIDHEDSEQLRSTLKAICETIFAKDYEELKTYASKKANNLHLKSNN